GGGRGTPRPRGRGVAPRAGLRVAAGVAGGRGGPWGRRPCGHPPRPYRGTAYPPYPPPPHAGEPGHLPCPGPPGRTTAPTCDTLPDLASHPPAYLVRRVTPPSTPGRSRHGRRRRERATGASGRATARTRR